MTLPKPILDRRTYAQLVSESVAQISRLSPEWTDYNASDPGITLIELAAWLSEQNLYRTDRFTPEISRAFLRLVGVVPCPPAAATTVILLSTTSAAAPVLQDRVQVSDAFGAITFETREGITISLAQLTHVLAGEGLQDVTSANDAAYEPAKGPRVGLYQPFGPSPKPCDALHLGFDRVLGQPGSAVSLHLWTATPELDSVTRNALIRESTIQQAEAKRDCPPGTKVSDWRRHHGVEVIWEYYAGAGTWRPLPQLEDETRALTLSGFVRFILPDDHASGGPAPAWFIRCHIVKGTFECAPWIDRIGHNAVTVEHAASIDAPESIGSTRGHASERYETDMSPIVAGSTRLALVSGAVRDEGWTEVSNWDLVGPHDKNYLLEPERGRITIGNGMRGAVLPAGWDLVVDYRVGGGPEGNITAGQLSKLAMSSWNAARVPTLAALAPVTIVQQPYAARGGALAETLPAAQARALAELSAPTTTVTLADFAVLARATPGVPVARARALANHHPALPCFNAPGVITVVVVPDCPGPAPTPTEAFLRAVHNYLYPRRPVTTELHVIAPTYVKVTATATIEACAGADPTALSTLAEETIARFFSPLSGGPQGKGWPVGRDVYRVEIMTLLASLPGVFSVLDLKLARGDEAPTCDNVAVCASDLVESGVHDISVTISGTTIFTRSRERECS